jgi:hypothetical protein
MGMLSFDVGHLHIDLVGVHRAFSVQGSPCGGELGATPADPAADGGKETTLRQHRSVDIRRPVSGVVYRSRRTDDRPASYRVIAEALQPPQ